MPYRAWILVAFLVLFAVSTIGHENTFDFVLEHLLTAAFLGVLIWFGWRRPLTNAAYTCIFLFLMLHLLGARYTYSKVPYDEWIERLTGETLTARWNLSRNHYDRAVHFCWGLLLYLPLREIVMRWTSLGRVKAGIIAIAFLAAMSAVYEMLEWLLTVVMSPERAETYNGQQGDTFDPQKDESLALVGSLLAAVATALKETLIPGRPSASSRIRF